MKALYPRNANIYLTITMLWLMTCVLFVAGFTIYRHRSLSFQKTAENQGLVEMASHVGQGITLMKTKGYSSGSLLPIEATYNLANATGIIEGLGPALQRTGINANNLQSEMMSLMLVGAANGMQTSTQTRIAIIDWYQMLSNVILDNEADPIKALLGQQNVLFQKYNADVRRQLFPA